MAFPRIQVNKKSHVRYALRYAYHAWDELLRGTTRFPAKADTLTRNARSRPVLLSRLRHGFQKEAPVGNSHIHPA